jgi:hypothetical protein
MAEWKLPQIVFTRKQMAATMLAIYAYWLSSRKTIHYLFIEFHIFFTFAGFRSLKKVVCGTHGSIILRKSFAQMSDRVYFLIFFPLLNHHVKLS